MDMCPRFIFQPIEESHYIVSEANLGAWGKNLCKLDVIELSW